MKYIGVIIILAIVLSLIYLIPENYYQGLIYLVFVFFSLHKLVKLLLLYRKNKKGISCKGTLISYKKSDKNEVFNINYDVDVEFLSPIDNKIYVIKGKQRQKPNKTLYNIALNPKKPEESIIVSQLSFEQVIFFVLALIVFSFLFIKALFY